MDFCLLESFSSSLKFERFDNEPFVYDFVSCTRGLIFRVLVSLVNKDLEYGFGKVSSLFVSFRLDDVDQGVSSGNDSYVDRNGFGSTLVDLFDVVSLILLVPTSVFLFSKSLFELDLTSSSSSSL